MTAPADAGLRDAARRNRRLGLTAGVVVALVAVVLLSLNTEGPLTPLKAIILGGVEGFTEYLPVSSTGHLLVVQRLLDLGDGDGKLAADTYAIAIQIGAILAVVVLYWRRLGQLASGAVGRDTDGRRLLDPAADRLRSRRRGRRDRRVTRSRTTCSGRGPSSSPGSSAVCSSCGGTRGPATSGSRRSPRVMPPSSVPRRSSPSGPASAAAWSPSRPRLAIGASMSAAVEFSFLLGLATLSAATLFDLAKDGGTLLDAYGWRTPLLGAVVAFVTAVIAVRWLVSFLRTRPLSIFGWYRIGIAVATIALIAAGAI